MLRLKGKDLEFARKTFWAASMHIVVTIKEKKKQKTDKNLTASKGTFVDLWFRLLKASVLNTCPC